MDDLYEKAKAFATKAHKDRGQKYGEFEYEFHLRSVVRILNSVVSGPGEGSSGKNNRLLRIAAWLHDVLEDTPVTREQLEQEFGKEVTDLVFAVTNEPGKNRKERAEKTYPKVKAHPLGITLKLADRIANVQASSKSNPRLLSMYKKEYPEFRKALYSDNANKMLWDFLDKLCGG